MADQMEALASREADSDKGKEPNPFSLNQLSGCLALFVPFMALLLWLCEWPAGLWRPISIALYLIVGIGAVTILLGLKLAGIKDDPVMMVLVLGCSLTLVICYSQISRHLYLLVGGFEAADGGYWIWLRYHLLNLLNGVLRNLPSSYEWSLVGAIRPTAFWSQSMVFLFSTLMDALITITLWRHISQVWTAWKSEKGTHTTYFGLLFAGSGRLLVMGIWFLPLTYVAAGVANGQISLPAWWGAVRALFPLCVALWVCGKGLHGWMVLKGSHRWLALATVAAAGWYLYTHWPEQLGRYMQVFGA